MEKFKDTSFPHFREDRAITKDSNYLQNMDKQAKVHDLEKHIDQIVYKLYDLTEDEIKIVEEGLL